MDQNVKFYPFVPNKEARVWPISVQNKFPIL